MTTDQSTIWDNLHLEKGLYSLSALQMDKAIEQFHLALKGVCRLEDTRTAMEAARYWQPRIQSRPVNPNALLTDYRAYPFSPGINGFKKSLLRWIADQIKRQKEPRFTTIETAFDLFLSIKDYPSAETFISFFIEQYPQKKELLYQLAQAQWLNKGKGKANKTYVQALLLAPDQVVIDRIENEALKKIITQFGPELAPAYGWISGFVPFVNCRDEITACNEQHQKALNAYKLLQQADKCMRNNDRKAATPYRKQLKAEAPELFEAYFKLLN